MVARKRQRVVKEEVVMNTGRWSVDEQKRFEMGMKKFGQNWELVADFVKSRNAIQTRSHAQKYLRSLARKKARMAGKLL